MANDNGMTDPFVVKYDNANGVYTNGDDARYGLGGLTAGLRGVGTPAFRSGVYPHGSDSSGIIDCRVTAQASPNMTVTILPGNYVVTRSGHGPYFGAVTASQTVSIASNVSGNPRWDTLVIRVRDSGISGDGTVTKSAYPFVIQGTPGSSPSIPSVTDGDLLLAWIYVASGVSSITSGVVYDSRPFTTAVGGIGLLNSYDTGSSGYEGQYRDNYVTNALERADGLGNWVPVAAPSAWTQFSPVLYATGSAFNLNLGVGAQYVGRYQQVGKRLDFMYGWRWGTGGLNGGSGAIVSYLPAGLVGAGYDQWFIAHLWVNSRQGYVGDFMGQAFVGANTNVVRPFFPVNLIGNTAPYQIASSIGVAGTGVPFISGSFPEGGYLQISGSIEIK